MKLNPPVLLQILLIHFIGILFLIPLIFICLLCTSFSHSMRIIVKWNWISWFKIISWLENTVFFLSLGIWDILVNIQNTRMYWNN